MSTLEAINRQYERLRKYDRENLSPEALIEKVHATKCNYFSQRDNYKQPHRTCNSSSNAMYLDWLLRVCQINDGLGGDDGYLKKVFSLGDTIYHGVQTQVIKDYGISTKWMTD